MGKGDKKTARGKTIMGSYGVTRKKNKKKPTCFSFRFFFSSKFSNFLFTDPSTAGLPAKLKHITQRRKRKQP